MKTNKTLEAFWFSIGSLSAFVFSIISAIILSRYLDKYNYGTYRQILFIYTSLLVVFSVGLPKATSYFLPKVNMNEGKDIVDKITKLLFIGGVLFTTALFFAAPIISNLLNNPELEKGLKLFSPIPMFLLPTLGLEGVCMTLHKSKVYAAYQLITRILMVISIVIPVLIIKNDYESAIYGWLFASVFSFALALYLKYKPFKGVTAVPSNIEYKDIIKYSSPLLFASLSGMLISFADQFYISRYFGPEIFAVYANGFMQLPIVPMITGATTAVLIPVFSKMVEEKNISEIKNVWKKALSKAATILYPITIFCMFNSQDIMLLMYGKKFEDSYLYFNIILVLNLFNIVAFFPMILALGETRFYSNVHFILVFIVWGLEYLCITVFKSPLSIAIVSVALSILKVIIMFRFITKKLKVGFLDFIPIQHIIKIFVICMFAGVIMFFNPFMKYFGDFLIIKFFTSLVLYSLMIIGFSKVIGVNIMELLYPLKQKLFPNR